MIREAAISSWERVIFAVDCTDLIRRLLAFARRQPLRPEITDMNALVGDIARLLGRILGEDVVLNLHLDAGLRPVMVDPSQLEAALVNFATNARDAMPKGGRLDITTSNVVLDASYAALHPERVAVLGVQRVAAFVAVDAGFIRRCLYLTLSSSRPFPSYV